MKEKTINLLKSKIFFAVAINIIIMVLCIQFTSFSYDSENDFYNSLYICYYHFYYSSKINYILSTLAGSLQYAFQHFNCFVLIQILLSWSAFTAITYVFADKYGKKKALAITLLINILFALNHYANIQSSKTAALLVAGGFLLLLDSINNKRYSLPFFVGIVLVCFGSFFDYRYFFIGLAFSVAFFLGDMVSKRKYKIPFRKFFWYFRPFLIVFVLVSIIVAGLNQYSYSVNQATEEAKNYYEYEQLSDSIASLPYPSYSDIKSQLNSCGITSENEYELLKSGYYDNYNTMGNEALKVISQTQQKNNGKTLLFVTGNIFTDIFNHIYSLENYSVIYIVFIALSAIFIIFHKKRFALFPPLYLVTGFISSIALRFLYSGESYTIYGIWLMMYLYLFNSLNFEQMKKCFDNPHFTSRKNRIIISSACLVLVFICSNFVFLYTAGSSEGSAPKSLYAEIDRHPDRYYVLDPVTANDYFQYTENFLHPLWGYRRGFLDNVDGFGYFHNTQQLRKRGLSDNIYEAILKYDKIYVIDNTITFRKERYLSQNYAQSGKEVLYTQVSELNGFKIYKVDQV